MAPKLIDLCQAASYDTKALHAISISRQVASYKMTYGVAKTLHDRMIKAMKREFFSLNIDESKANNESKFLTFLASYYCESQKRIVIVHLASVCLSRLDSKALYFEVVNVFKKYNLDWGKLCSILLDSCSTMRGLKAGLEVRIRDGNADGTPAVAKHLLNIGGDTCHHFHNIVKRICKPFDRFIEKLFNNIHLHFKNYPDQRGQLKKICKELGIHFVLPERFLDHRWLSVLDVSYSIWPMIAAYLVYFYARLPEVDERTYSKLIKEEVFEELTINEASQRNIAAIQKNIKKRKIPEKGSLTIISILDALFKYYNKTLLIIRFYMGVLEIFKQYVCKFQSTEPLIHKVYDEQESVLRNYMAFFVKSEHFSTLMSHELLTLKVEDKHLESESRIHYGSLIKKLMTKFGKDDRDVKWFIEKVKESYKNTLPYMQDKLATTLGSKVLLCLSALDPVFYGIPLDPKAESFGWHLKGRRAAKKRLLDIPNHVKFVLSSEKEEEGYDLEVHKLDVDQNLPLYEENSRVDEWWSQVKKTGLYPNLTKMVFALLTCFHGPIVESSFNIMEMIQDKRSYNMSTDTYNSYQTTHQYFKAHSTNAIKEFARKNPADDPIDLELCQNMKDSASKNDERIEQQQEENGGKKDKSMSKRANREEIIKEEREAIDKHMLASEKWAKERSKNANIKKSSGRESTHSERKKEKVERDFIIAKRGKENSKRDADLKKKQALKEAKEKEKIEEEKKRTLKRKNEAAFTNMTEKVKKKKIL